MSKPYRIVEGGMHDRFHKSRAKIQFLGGGFGNGKTAALCVKALMIAHDYPGSNGLIARSTYPKLNDTIRKEFFKWCPSEWVKRRPTQDDNTCYLKNGSIINFRYVAQRGKETEESKSNLLSATYDWIVVDQIEDPEFSHKDFMDLIGRLRGTVEYVGSDRTMPRVGPQWMMLSSNPSRNWVFREIIQPLHQFKNGLFNPKLLCEVDPTTGSPILIDGKPKPIIELFEGSTYENVDNVGQEYINTMLSTYTGSMRKRFIFGEWGALEGLVYPMFSESVHVLDHAQLEEYLHQLRVSGYEPQPLEGYDHGLGSPSCYGLAFTDDDGNVFLLDGYYRNETTVEQLARGIQDIREKYNFRNDLFEGGIYADPQLFRRTPGNRTTVGVVVADLFAEEGVRFRRANNEISAGIAKVSQYLAPMPRHEHPITGAAQAPHFFVSSECQWLINEITEYFWKKNTSGDRSDIPVDRNDHAMDMMKYMLTGRPRLAKFIGRPNEPPAYMSWHEVERQEQQRTLPRHK